MDVEKTESAAARKHLTTALERAIARAIEFIMRANATIAGVIFAGCVLLNFANVVGRYAFSKPIYWAEEITVHMIAWCVMLGASVVAARNDHLKVEILEFALGERMLRVYQIVVAIMVAAICGLVGWYGYALALKLWAMDQRSIVAQVPMIVPYGALPIGFTLIVLVSLARLYELIRAADGALLPKRKP